MCGSLGAPGLDSGSGAVNSVTARVRRPQDNFLEGDRTRVFPMAFGGKRKEGEGNRFGSQSFGKSR